MERKRLLKILDVIIALGMLYLLFMLIYPSYKKIRENNLQTQVITNMYEIRCELEHYAAFNYGTYPNDIREIEPYLVNNKLPVNPYTKKRMRFDNFQINQYKSITGTKEDNPVSINGKFTGKPGNIVYSYFIPPGNTFVTAYGLVGFSHNGKPIYKIDPAKKHHIVVLHL